MANREAMTRKANKCHWRADWWGNCDQHPSWIV